MQASSVSDFEHFATKVKKHTTVKIQKIEEDASAYALKKEEEAQQTAVLWSQTAHAALKRELFDGKRQGTHAITEEVTRQWSAYVNARESALKSVLRGRIEASFPSFAACFVSWVSQQYDEGVLTMPQAYFSLSDTEKFDVIPTEKEQVVFRNGSLYIEYSVDRIIEELEDEILSRIHLEKEADTPWQV